MGRTPQTHAVQLSPLILGYDAQPPQIILYFLGCQVCGSS